MTGFSIATGANDHIKFRRALVNILLNEPKEIANALFTFALMKITAKLDKDDDGAEASSELLLLKQKAREKLICLETFRDVCDDDDDDDVMIEMFLEFLRKEAVMVLINEKKKNGEEEEETINIITELLTERFFSEEVIEEEKSSSRLEKAKARFVKIVSGKVKPWLKTETKINEAGKTCTIHTKRLLDYDWTAYTTRSCSNDAADVNKNTTTSKTVIELSLRVSSNNNSETAGDKETNKFHEITLDLESMKMVVYALNEARHAIGEATVIK